MSQHGTEHGILGDMVPRQPGGSGKVEFRGLMCAIGSFSTPSIGDNLIPPFNRESLLQILQAVILFSFESKSSYVGICLSGY